jgi:hypothetical protein
LIHGAQDARRLVVLLALGGGDGSRLSLGKPTQMPYCGWRKATSNLESASEPWSAERLLLESIGRICARAG